MNWTARHARTLTCSPWPGPQMMRFYWFSGGWPYMLIYCTFFPLQRIQNATPQIVSSSVNCKTCSHTYLQPVARSANDAFLLVQWGVTIYAHIFTFFPLQRIQNATPQIVSSSMNCKTCSHTYLQPVARSANDAFLLVQWGVTKYAHIYIYNYIFIQVYRHIRVYTYSSARWHPPGIHDSHPWAAVTTKQEQNMHVKLPYVLWYPKDQVRQFPV